MTPLVTLKVGSLRKSAGLIGGRTILLTLICALQGFRYSPVGFLFMYTSSGSVKLVQESLRRSLIVICDLDLVSSVSCPLPFLYTSYFCDSNSVQCGRRFTVFENAPPLEAPAGDGSLARSVLSTAWRPRARSLRFSLIYVMTTYLAAEASFSVLPRINLS